MSEVNLHFEISPQGLEHLPNIKRKQEANILQAIQQQSPALANKIVKGINFVFLQTGQVLISAFTQLALSIPDYEIYIRKFSF